MSLMDASRLAGDARDLGQRLLQIVHIARAAPCEFAQNRDLRQAGPDIVVQVGGDARAHAFEFEQPPQPVAVRRKEEHGQRGSGRQDKPPPHPKRRQNREGNLSRLDAAQTGRVHGADQKPVPAGRQAGIVHAAILRRGTPVTGGAFQAVLVAELFARREAQANKIELDEVLTGGEHRSGDPAFSQFGNRVGRSADAHAGDQDGRRRAGAVGFRDQSRESQVRGKPECPVTVSVGGRELARAEPVGRSVVADAAAVGVQPVDTVPGPHVDPTREVFGNALHGIAGETLGGANSNDARVRRSRIVDAAEATLAAGDPEPAGAIEIQVLDVTRRQTVGNREEFKLAVAVASHARY